LLFDTVLPTRSLDANRIRQLTKDDIARALPDRHVACAVQSNLTVLRCLEKQITSLERLTKTQVKPKGELAILKTILGIGDILGAHDSLGDRTDHALCDSRPLCLVLSLCGESAA